MMAPLEKKILCSTAMKLNDENRNNDTMKRNTMFYLYLLCAVLFPFLTHASDTAPLPLPFECAFDSEDDMAGWSVFNRDDHEESWKMSQSDMGGVGIGSDASPDYAPTDNWLVTPALQFEEGGRYQLSFMAYIAYYYEEKLRITVGTSPDPESQTTVVDEVNIPKYDGYYGQKVAVMLPDLPAGTYYVGLQYITDSPQTMCICINKFKIETMQEGSVSGMVLTSAGKAMSGIDVKLSGVSETVVQTDESGSFLFKDVTQGDYTVSTKVFGYAEVSKSITVEPEETAICNITLKELEKTTLKGSVMDTDGNPVAGASVRLSGYADYRTFTDEAGNYSISGIYLDDFYTSYHAVASKNFYTGETGTLYIYNWGDNTYDFTVESKPVPPYSVNVTSTDDATSSTVSWTFPVDLAELSFDNGEPKSDTSIGFDNSHADSNILGVVFREPMTVYGAKWYMTLDSRATQVNVNIIELDAEGNPTSNVIYTQADVPFNLGEWSSVTFPAPVKCPNGFIVALSSEGHISLALDTNTEILDNKTQFYSNTMNDATAFTFFEDVDWSGAMLIRATGECLEPNAVAPEMTYNVYRFASTDIDDESKWTQIGTGLNELSMTDNQFGEIPAGTYYYAVSAINALKAVESVKTKSDAVHTRCYTRVTANVSANSVPADAIGAVIKITDGKGHNYTATVGTDNTAVIDNVWKGSYTLSAVHKGFTFDPVTVDLGTNEEYSVDVVLNQILAPVTNIDYATNDEGNATILRWDLFADIFDDFEGDEYADFEINPAGKIGWTYIDNDNKPTYGFAGSEFPGMNGTMAAIIMNGEAVVPPVTTDISYSGNRELAFFACTAIDTEGGIQRFESDDYVISPELSYHKEFTLSFFARTYMPQDGIYERLRVGYSSTGNNLEDFEWFTEYLDVPEAYSQYQYTIPADARYITINSSSPDGFILLVDDIKLSTGIQHSGAEPSQGAFDGYNIYVDNTFVTKTTTAEYTLDWSGLTEGVHTVGVTKLYASGESEPLEVSVNISTSGVEAVEAEPVKMTMLRNNILSISGSHNGVTVYSVAGETVAKADAMQSALNLDNLPNGVYIARAQVEGAPAVIKKIIVR